MRYLLLLVFATTVAAQDYDRKTWKHWVDEDGDCQDTRQEVLIRDAIGEVVFKTEKKCKVECGLWYDPFSGKFFTDPSDLDIDHMVPLKNAHLSGGAEWSEGAKKAYANDLNNPNHLMAVHDRLNQSKSYRGPEEWMPPNEEFHCAYVRTWEEIKRRWELKMTEDEKRMIEMIKEECSCPTS